MLNFKNVANKQFKGGKGVKTYHYPNPAKVRKTYKIRNS